MLQLSEKSYHVAKLVVVKADKYGKVMLDTNKYSTSPRLALSTVYLEVCSDTVKVMDEKYNEIVKHARLYEKYAESMDWLPYIYLMSKRPNALKYTGFYQELPDVWRKYLNDAEPQIKRDALMALNAILQKHDISTATDALSATLAKGVKDAASIITSYQRITSHSPNMQPMKLSDNVIDMPAFSTDNNIYDSLLRKQVSQ